MRSELRIAGLALALLAGLTATAIRSAAGPGAGIVPPEYPQIGLPDAAAGQALLDNFRQAGFATGDYYLEFTLRQVPRRGDEQDFQGRLWGGRRGQAMLMRISLRDAAGSEHRLLVQNGPQPSIWSESGGRVANTEESSILAPLVSGVEVTAFDLQMPYLFWPDVRVVGLNRIRGRPAYAFLFKAPPAFASLHPDPAAVRAFLDTEFDRPLQVDVIGRDGGVLKTLSIVDLKKIDGQWILKQFDLLNQATRDYTRFNLTAVALGLEFGPAVLSPDRLGEKAPVPAANRLRHLGP